jgi:hypothetical protein
MIAIRERSNQNESGRRFKEWASLFSGKLFVKIVAYADESGTHDKTGVQKGAREMSIGGIAALREDWIPFCSKWQKVLNKYDAPYFHFREWSSASGVARKIRKPSSDFQKNPYRNWESKRLNEFLIELAKIAGSGNKIIFGSRNSTKVFNEVKMAGYYPHISYPFQFGIEDFFSNFMETLELQKAPWKRLPVSFFFDQSDDAEWRHAITDTFFFYKAKHPQFSEITFADKKNPLHLPLQAADMFAYRARQIDEKVIDNDHTGFWPELDNALLKPMLDFFASRNQDEVWKYLAWRLNR